MDIMANGIYGRLGEWDKEERKEGYVEGKAALLENFIWKHEIYIDQPLFMLILRKQHAESFEF